VKKITFAVTFLVPLWLSLILSKSEQTDRYLLWGYSETPQFVAVI